MRDNRGGRAPVMGASIGESSGIPKGKKLLRRVEIGFAPLFTGQVFFQPPGLHWRDSREVTERTSLRLRAGEGWHARAPVVGGPDTLHGAR